MLSPVHSLRYLDGLRTLKFHFDCFNEKKNGYMNGRSMLQDMPGDQIGAPVAFIFDPSPGGCDWRIIFPLLLCGSRNRSSTHFI